MGELSSLLDEEALAGVPGLVYANKQDLLNAKKAAEIMDSLELTSIKSRWVHIEACSAKTGEGQGRHHILSAARMHPGHSLFQTGEVILRRLVGVLPQTHRARAGRGTALRRDLCREGQPSTVCRSILESRCLLTACGGLAHAWTFSVYSRFVEAEGCNACS